MCSGLPPGRQDLPVGLDGDGSGIIPIAKIREAKETLFAALTAVAVAGIFKVFFMYAGERDSFGICRL